MVLSLQLSFQSVCFHFRLVLKCSALWVSSHQQIDGEKAVVLETGIDRQHRDHLKQVKTGQNTLQRSSSLGTFSVRVCLHPGGLQQLPQVSSDEALVHTETIAMSLWERLNHKNFIPAGRSGTRL